MTPVRVLVVLPLYGGSLPIGRYCSTALADLGHTVEVFEGPAFHGAFTALKDLRAPRDRVDYLENGFLQVVSQAVLAKVESFRPDLVLALAQAPLTRQALKRLRRDGVATAMWFVEDRQLFTYWRAFAPHYDFFAVIQRDPFLGELAAAGVEHALYLPLAALPSFHRPLELTPVERRRFGSDVSFLGAGYANRRAAFKRLLKYDFRIWGSDWDGDHALEGRVQLGGARVSPEDAVKIYNATTVNLNLHSSVQSRDLVPGGDFVNPRTFELAACGAFQLVDRRALLPMHFDAHELATFGSMDELETALDYYLDEPEARREMAEAARARVLREHTYQARMETLLAFVAERRPGWPAPREAGPPLPEDFPEDLKQGLKRLMEELKLPPDAPFEDVIWTLRQREQPLSGLEASLLFLDEWRKQYARK
ncbi:MAG: glycosyltransferase [Desulfovibrionaceae bacterium]|jgi:spore maturation protein CgeB|nr:glycosyltransferase [Desulfovibrionaceae bacterium]